MNRWQSLVLFINKMWTECNYCKTSMNIIKPLSPLSIMPLGCEEWNPAELLLSTNITCILDLYYSIKEGIYLWRDKRRQYVSETRISEQRYLLHNTILVEHSSVCTLSREWQFSEIWLALLAIITVYMHLMVNPTGYSTDLSMQQQTCKQFTAWTEYLKQFISVSMHSHGHHLQRRKGTHILQPIITAYTDTISMTTETCYYASSDDRVHSRVATNVNRCGSIPR